MDTKTLRGKYAQTTPIYVKHPDEMHFIFDEWAYQCEVQQTALPEPMIFVCDVPGQNSAYLLDTPFYTLQNDSFEFLGNPLAFSNSGIKKSALTKHISDAWVVYSIESLRDVFSSLAYVRSILGGRVPSHFCTGIMRRETWGITCSTITRLSASDLKRIEKDESRHLSAHVENRQQAERKKQTRIDWSVAPSRLKKKRRVQTLPSIDFNTECDGGDHVAGQSRFAGSGPIEANKTPVQDALAKLSQQIAQGKIVSARHITRRRGNMTLPAIPS